MYRNHNCASYIDMAWHIHTCKENQNHNKSLLYHVYWNILLRLLYSVMWFHSREKSRKTCFAFIQGFKESLRNLLNPWTSPYMSNTRRKQYTITPFSPHVSLYIFIHSEIRLCHQYIHICATNFFSKDQGKMMTLNILSMITPKKKISTGSVCWTCQFLYF